jgi:hypothetical protein
VIKFRLVINKCVHDRFQIYTRKCKVFRIKCVILFVRWTWKAHNGTGTKRERKSAVVTNLCSCETGEVTIHCLKLIIMPRTLPIKLQRCKRSNWQFMNTGTNLTRLKCEVKEIFRLAKHVVQNNMISFAVLLNDSWKCLSLCNADCRWVAIQSVSGMILTGENRNIGGKRSVPVPLCPPKILHWLGPEASD